MNHYLTIISVNAQKIKENNAKQVVAVVTADSQSLAPEEKEILNSLITVAVYKK